MKILLVEDDFYLQRDLTKILNNEGYGVIAVSSVAMAKQHVLADKNIDLFLLDLWLPDGDGFELLSFIRKCSTSPAIFITACDDEESVIRGLDLGADDYITKPFRNKVLLSRIHANLRRVSGAAKVQELSSEGLVLNPISHEVRIEGAKIELRPVEFKLLHILMKNAGILLKREYLLDELSYDSEEPVEDNTLSVNMSRLRSRIGQDYIETVRGFGYRFCKEVKVTVNL